MSPNVTQVDYQLLRAVISKLEQEAERVGLVLHRVNVVKNKLERDGWVGENADAFMHQMNLEVLPGIQRLQKAYNTASSILVEIIVIYQTAEQEAAAQLTTEQPLDEQKAEIQVNGTAKFAMMRSTDAPVKALVQNEDDGRPPYDPSCAGEAYISGYCTYDMRAADPVSVTEYFMSQMETEGGSLFLTEDGLDGRRAVAEGLTRAIQEGRLDQASAQRLLKAARSEVGWSYSPSSAALYALAFADTQGGIWQAWEDNNIVPIIYFGSSGVFDDYSQIPGGGNCATFISMALLAAGLTQSDDWGLGAIETRHDDYRGNDTQYFAGTTLSNGNRIFTGAANLIEWLFTNGELTSDACAEVTFGVNDKQSQFPDGVATATSELRAGDLIFSTDTDRNLQRDHVAIVVGWGDPTGGPGAAFYATPEEAAAAGVTNAVPYTVDHGGRDPQTYPRPWTETVTTDQTSLGPSPDIRIDFVNLEPTQRD